MARIVKPSKTLRSEFKRIDEQQRRNNSNSAFEGSGVEIIDYGQAILPGSITVPNNGLLLVDGGDVVMLNADLVEVFRLGIQEFLDRGLTIRRDDNSIALEMRKPFSATGTQVLLWRDRVGRVTGGDSLLSPTGFDAPHQNMPFIPVDFTSSATAQTTSSATFVATHEHRGFRQNPALKPQFKVMCSDGTTAAEIQFYDVPNAVYLGGFLAAPAVQTIVIPAGTTTFTLFELASGAFAIPGSMSDPIHLEIHARVTAGTGSVSVAPVRTIGSGF